MALGRPLAPSPAAGHARAVRAFVPVLLRDLAIAAATAGLAALDARVRAGGGAAGAPGVALGALTGIAVTLTAFLAHEWGHWLGAALSGARVERPASPSPFLFHFDVGTSTRAQFLWMSCGGYLASALALAAIAAWADLGAPSGVVALALSSLGVLVTLALELPTTIGVVRGGPLPTGAVYVERPRDDAGP